jgi:CheY-like chemotaxis protein
MQLSENVHTVNSGEEALTYLQLCRKAENFPEVILLDLLMPDMDSCQFMEMASILGLLSDPPFRTARIT